jgi:hypothetical protein
VCWSGAWPWRALVRAHAVIGMVWAALGATRASSVGYFSGNGGHWWMQGIKGKQRGKVARAR